MDESWKVLLHGGHYDGTIVVVRDIGIDIMMMSPREANLCFIPADVPIPKPSLETIQYRRINPNEAAIDGYPIWTEGQNRRRDYLIRLDAFDHITREEYDELAILQRDLHNHLREREKREKMAQLRMEMARNHGMPFCLGD